MTRQKETIIEIDAPPKLRTRVRRVDYVPLRHLNAGIPSDELDGIGHIPGFVPDPLFDENFIRLPQNETHAFWISLVPQNRAAAGEYSLRVRWCRFSSRRWMKSSARLNF